MFLLSFLLLFYLSCFYTLRPFQTVLLTSSCGAGRREIGCFQAEEYRGLLSDVLLYYTLSCLRGNKKPQFTPYAKWGVVSPEALLRKIGFVVHGLYTHKGLNSFFQYTKLKMKFCFNLCSILAFPVMDMRWVTKLRPSPAIIL